MSTDASRPRRTTARHPPFAVQALHLAGVFNLAIAQPLLDLLGRSPAFFVAHRIAGLELIVAVALLCLGCPALLVATTAAARSASRRLGLAVYRASLGAMAALGILSILGRSLPWPGVVLVVLAASLAVVLVAALRRPQVQSFVSVLSLLSAAVPLVFLLVSPARSLVWAAVPPSPTPTPDGPAAAVAARDTPVVVLLFDELPLSSLLDGEGSVDAARFPHFARLADTSTWYSMASSVAAATETAVPAILTGRRPRAGQAPHAGSHPRNLFTLLGATHHLEVVESITQLCPPSLCAREEDAADRWSSLARDSFWVALHVLLPADLAGGVPEIDTAWRGFGELDTAAAAPTLSESDPLLASIDVGVRDLDVPGDFSRFLERVRTAPRASLHYLHLQLPHVPWRYLPSGREYGPIASNFGPGAQEGGVWTEDRWPIALSLARHLLQVGYADALLGRSIATLEEAGLWDDALVVVLSDHGLSFRAGQPGRKLTEANAEEVLAIPLFVKLPGQRRGSIDARNVSTVDLLPTLGEALGLAPFPWDTDGRSLLGDAADGANAPRAMKRWHLGSGEAVERPFTSWTGGREGARLQRALVGDGDLDSVARVGPRPDLLGIDVADLRRDRPALVEVASDQPWLWDRVDPSSRFRPVYLTGHARGADGGEAGAVLAVALNGTVVATTRTHAGAQGERYAALLPEDALIAGRNVLEIFSLGPDGELRATVDRSTTRYSLESRGRGAHVIRASNGTECVPQRGAVRGQAELRDLAFLGWAADPTRPSRRAIVMVFIDGELVHSAVSDRPPPGGSSEPAGADPVLGLDVDLDKAGFLFRMPPPLLAQGSEIRLFAVVGDRCSELPLAAVRPS